MLVRWPTIRRPTDMGCARQLSFGRARMFSRAAAILAVLFSQGICALRSGPAPAPGPAAFGGAAPLGTAAPASAPAPSPAASSASGTGCACNPSLLAASGMCKVPSTHQLGNSHGNYVNGEDTGPFRLPTRWSCNVDPHNPLPEYPRPQLERQNWQSLNGVWEWLAAPAFNAGTPPFNTTLDMNIVVPFPIQSDLSGLDPQHTAGVSRMWYRRNFAVPAAWATNAVLLNFGAVDWEAEVWVNGHRLGQHRGGYDKFSYDITSALASSTTGTHELIVRVWDPTESAHIPVGKQRMIAPGGIWYTASSGIWQTVWMESVNDQHITRLDMIPDIDNELLQVTVQGSPSASGLPVSFQLGENTTQLAVAQGVVGQPFNVSVPDPRLWSPQDPYLYTVFVDLYSPSNSSKQLGASEEQPMLDQVKGYAGMRKIALCQGGPDSPLRTCLNNQPILQIGLLDQGFWPDGLHTAPTDEALQYDMDMILSVNLTTLRKHIKVEPDRWYYHADRKGVLVWQDMPALAIDNPYTGNFGYFSKLAGEKAQYEAEMKRMIEDHLSFPSIIQYQTFNEGWGQYDTQRVVQQAKGWDPSRLFDAASGWVDPQDATDNAGGYYQHYPGYVGDIRDDHHYPEPVSSGVTETRASVAGEYGGVGNCVSGNSWFGPCPSDGGQDDGHHGNLWTNNPNDMLGNFTHLLNMLPDLFSGQKAMSAVIYTQVSDVEGELNGLLTYDRQVFKAGDRDAMGRAISSVLNTQF